MDSKESRSISSLTTTALELSCSAVTDSFVGEAWCGYPPSADSAQRSAAPILSSFFTPSALYLAYNSSSTQAKVPIDINLARSSAESHIASLNLFTAAQGTSSPFSVVAADLAEDQILRKLNFPVSFAVVVPIVVPAGNQSIVLVLYCSRKSEVRECRAETYQHACISEI